ncbi:amino-acid N-acetyltransferase [Burkholderia pseudomultivorans]|uniref:Amino-acid acetyltransferase n=2 Tax=Burkholderia cepacia complex TaxID=87882 RepID=A0A132EBQ6_9BURK|nr:amino-acid N-acetyltransferase [Burkholderia pseudomultivorans]KWF23873.1 N-acetylglutamate synthase [Burkholderia pseudomultivorans]MDR8731906.1 Amino-acid acetyltransferase [Burkholderia pseudomultivorans]MDR8738919.1 Amino-acid acetyltransferase [Burkholderia pseudomultivorans]MDR8745664.1 Amino-acid acetyltransferase [Burkholderia pseudomultivorans]MDR8757754.1 Amino-acid acetyltransferase [Burkholderia pseudomultivorans]
MNSQTDLPPAQTGDANPPAADDTAASHAQFVDWMRSVAPYIHKFRNNTFVVGFGGEVVQQGLLNALVSDIALLQAMGIQIVLVHGSRPQVEEQLNLHGVESEFSHGLRITDARALESAKEAAGEVRLDIEAAISQGLPNSPMAHAHISVVSGNFVTARPVGILDGVDFAHTGIVRKIDAESIRHSLASRKLVLLSPLGFSPTGEAFNLSMEDVASAAAIALRADKIVFLTEGPGIVDDEGALIREMSLDSAADLLDSGDLQGDDAFFLKHAIRACRGGVTRAHLIPQSLDGSMLLELFLHDGVGTMISYENLESLREATPDDVGGILSLIEPLETDGTLVRRGRHQIERDIDHFSVIEHDGVLFGCAALYPYQQEKIGEMACLTVAPEAQGSGDGERLLKRIEQRARARGLTHIFVLTTRTEHWFLKRGFVKATVDDLPEDRRKLYNWQRKSLVLMKQL